MDTLYRQVLLSLALNDFKMKSIIVTGVSGFLGRYVARHYSELGWCVIGIDGSSRENAPMADINEYYPIKLPNSAFSDILKKHAPDAFIHCAGRASVGQSLLDPSPDYYGNTVLTFEMLNEIRLNAPECRFVLLSSAAVYGDPVSLPVSETQLAAPISPYGYHKMQCEQLCEEFSKLYNLPTACARIFSAYGPGLRRQVIWDMCTRLLSSGTLVLHGSGNESRDFIHALDIANALSIIVDNSPMKGDIYNVASGREVTINELANIVIKALGANVKPNFDNHVRKGDPLNWKADISKIEKLGFRPNVQLDEGVIKFAQWCKMSLP